MGIALAMYSDENDQWLPPGPRQDPADPVGLDNTQAPWYNNTHTPRKWLPYYLTSGMSLPSPATVGTTTNYIAQIFICPGYDKAVQADSTNRYIPTSDNYSNAYSYTDLKSTNSAEIQIPFRPFGKNTAQEASHKITELNGDYAPSKIFALADLDNQGSAVSPYAANHPVHGSVRNYFYFDSHVQGKKVTTAAAY
jgi:hypothetical protein